MKHTASTKISEGIVDQKVPSTNLIKLSGKGAGELRENNLCGGDTGALLCIK